MTMEGFSPTSQRQRVQRGTGSGASALKYEMTKGNEIRDAEKKNFEEYVTSAVNDEKKRIEYIEDATFRVVRNQYIAEYEQGLRTGKSNWTNTMAALRDKGYYVREDASKLTIFKPTGAAKTAFDYTVPGYDTNTGDPFLGGYKNSYEDYWKKFNNEYNKVVNRELRENYAGKTYDDLKESQQREINQLASTAATQEAIDEVIMPILSTLQKKAAAGNQGATNRANSLTDKLSGSVGGEITEQVMESKYLFGIIPLPGTERLVYKKTYPFVAPSQGALAYIGTGANKQYVYKEPSGQVKISKDFVEPTTEWQLLSGGQPIDYEFTHKQEQTQKKEALRKMRRSDPLGWTFETVKAEFGPGGTAGLGEIGYLFASPAEREEHELQRVVEQQELQAQVWKEGGIFGSFLMSPVGELALSAGVGAAFGVPMTIAGAKASLAASTSWETGLNIFGKGMLAYGIGSTGYEVVKAGKERGWQAGVGELGMGFLNIYAGFKGYKLASAKTLDLIGVRIVRKQLFPRWTKSRATVGGEKFTAERAAAEMDYLTFMKSQRNMLDYKPQLTKFEVKNILAAKKWPPKERAALQALMTAKRTGKSGGKLEGGAARTQYVPFSTTKDVDWSRRTIKDLFLFKTMKKAGVLPEGMDVHKALEPGESISRIGGIAERPWIIEQILPSGKTSKLQIPTVRELGEHKLFSTYFEEAWYRKPINIRTPTKAQVSKAIIGKPLKGPKHIVDYHEFLRAGYELKYLTGKMTKAEATRAVKEVTRITKAKIKRAPVLLSDIGEERASKWFDLGETGKPGEKIKKAKGAGTKALQWTDAALRWDTYQKLSSGVLETIIPKKLQAKIIAGKIRSAEGTASEESIYKALTGKGKKIKTRAITRKYVEPSRVSKSPMTTIAFPTLAVTKEKGAKGHTDVYERDLTFMGTTKKSAIQDKVSLSEIFKNPIYGLAKIKSSRKSVRSSYPLYTSSKTPSSRSTSSRSGASSVMSSLLSSSMLSASSTSKSSSSKSKSSSSRSMSSKSYSGLPAFPKSEKKTPQQREKELLEGGFEKWMYPIVMPGAAEIFGKKFAKKLPTLEYEWGQL